MTTRRRSNGRRNRTRLMPANTLGNFIYVLLVIAVVLFLVRLVSGRRVV